MSTTYYKALCEGGISPHQSVQWALPTKQNDDWTPGEWMPEIEGELVECENGYHVCEAEQLLPWLDAEIYEVEVRGETLNCDDKAVCQQARLIRRFEAWNARTARLFACDCAERVLHLYEDKHPDDSRPRDAIAVARRFAVGNATRDELLAACGAAAAARDAARDARDARAAWGAASAAAWAAESAAARDAEREWQTSRLIQCLKGKNDAANQ